MIRFAVNLCLQIMRIIGLWRIFKKCNIKGIWAIVPVANNFKLAQCADDEDSGSVWCLSHFLFTAFYAIETVLSAYNRTDSKAYLMVAILAVIFGIINIIYSIRVYSSICEAFGKKKIWVVFWVFFETLVTVIWGVSKDVQPIPAAHQETVTTAGRKAERLSEGLTVNINKRTVRSGLFTRKTMLRDIHFNIEPGKMVLLLGGSGAGKSTLINAITGYEPADATVLLHGTDVYKDFRKVIYDIGVVPQQELIRNTDTVYRTLLDAAALRMPADTSARERKSRVNEVMDVFGLTPIKSHIISKQSGGQKKRISIATEYISNPSLFILDEPDSGLDGILARELMQKLHDISREGKIVIVVTHTPDRVIDLFDEIIVIAKDSKRTGRLVFKGPVAEAKKFFDADSMEKIVRTINRPEEGGLGRTEELLQKFNDMREEAADNA